MLGTRLSGNFFSAETMAKRKKKNEVSVDERLRRLNTMQALEYIQAHQTTPDEESEYLDAKARAEDDEIRTVVNVWVTKYPNKKFGTVRVPKLGLLVDIFVVDGFALIHRVTKLH